MYPTQLPGRILPTTQSPHKRRSFSAFILALLLFAGAAYTGLQLWLRPRAHAEGEAQAATAPATVALRVAQAEDLLAHLENAAAAHEKAIAEVNRSQQWMNRLVPSLAHEHMRLEKTRVEAAEAASRSARQYVEQARQELEIVKNLLRERTEKP